MELMFLIFNAMEDHESRLPADLVSFTWLCPGSVDMSKLKWGYQDEEPDQLAAITVTEPFKFHGTIALKAWNLLPVLSF